jgi:hypothetical protein
MEWKIHEKSFILSCKCGEHHYHVILVGSSVYLQCGRCGELISIIINYDLMKKLKNGHTSIHKK